MTPGAPPPEPSNAAEGRAIGRYRLFGEIAAGGMATVHVGRLVGPAGFSRTVAIKRLHPQFAKDPEFVAMFLDEARLAARVRHPNVVSTLDVVALENELFLVMDYVQGESLSRLLRGAARFGVKPPPRVVSSIVIQALLGLHAAHEAVSDRGGALGIVHRDVSPQNILVGTDGIARMVDFGVAKAASRAHTTQDGQLKGKLGYMAPEQLSDGEVDRRADIFACGIVLWESLTGQRLFASNDPAGAVAKILNQAVPPPSRFAPEIPPEIDALVLHALEKKPSVRFSTAREMAAALERALAPAGALEVGGWVEENAKQALDERARRVQEIESISSSVDVLALREQAPSKAPVIFDGEARSGLTELSSAAVNSAPSPPSRTRRVLLAMVMVLGAALAVALVVLAARSQKTHPPVVTPTPPPSEPAPAAVPPNPPTVATPAATPETTASAPEPAPSSKPAAPVSRTAPVKKPIQSKTGAAKANCDPPYVIDATGAKRFKPECF